MRQLIKQLKISVRMLKDKEYNQSNEDSGSRDVCDVNDRSSCDKHNNNNNTNTNRKRPESPAVHERIIQCFWKQSVCFDLFQQLSYFKLFYCPLIY